jgi:hypothetical protein
MTRVLLVGYDPESVDFSGIALALKQMTDRGWEAEVCYIRPDGTARQAVEHHLASAKYDCITRT